MEPDINTVWVAGETGLVGRAVLRRLARESCTVLSAPHSALDLTSQRDTLDWLMVHKPDAIVMAAARVGGIGANAAYPADFIADNLKMTLNVIDGAYRAGVKKLLYLGSSCIYPKHAAQPIKEEALLTGPLEETNEAYAIAKIAGLKMCHYYRQQYGCSFISAMPTNLYGPHDRFDTEKSHVIPSLIMKIHAAKMNDAPSVELWGTGAPLREFLYADDLADALVFLINHYNDSLPVNIGSGREISIKDLAEKIKSLSGYTGKIIFNSAYPDGTPRKLLDTSRLAAMGWKPATSFDDGLARAYAWYVSHYDSGDQAAA